MSKSYQAQGWDGRMFDELEALARAQLRIGAQMHAASKEQRRVADPIDLRDVGRACACIDLDVGGSRLA
jgi:hypothetical protein